MFGPSTSKTYQHYHSCVFYYRTLDNQIKWLTGAEKTSRYHAILGSSPRIWLCAFGAVLLILARWMRGTWDLPSERRFHSCWLSRTLRGLRCFLFLLLGVNAGCVFQVAVVRAREIACGGHMAGKWGMGSNGTEKWVKAKK